MKICIVGLQAEFQEHCRAVLSDSPADEWELVVSSYQPDLPQADVYIWDFRPESGDRPVSPDLFRKILFVVEPKHLTQFRTWLGTTRASILLKPVHSAALRPFLESSMRRSQNGASIRGFDPEASHSEVEDLLDCLLQANLKLQEYDQFRTNFLARAVHDFRAPLTALSGYCGLLMQQRLGPLSTDQIDLLGRMQHSLKRVSRLADAMFDLSVRRNTKKQPDFKIGDIEATISQAVHEITPHAAEKQIRITVSVENPAQPLLFDEVQIEQVLVNLLENACKFTAKNGTIDVSAYPVCQRGPHPRTAERKSAASTRGGHAEVANAYRIDMRDSGMGIPSAHIESIFEEYTSYAGGNDRSGGGLGLAICRMIVDAHGGSIWAESSEAGAQFSFVIPLTVAAQDGWGRVESMIAAPRRKALSA